MNEVLYNLLNEEEKRQNEGLELIASENYTSKDVRALCGSILTNKYAEGYPGKRYYGGCEVIDKIEQYTIDLACRLFDCKYANVQPHSGSQANFAAYRALAPNGGKILSLDLKDGGHLTHGASVSFSGVQYKVVHYELDVNGYINYNSIYNKLITERPNIVVAGFSSYPYKIDFWSIRKLIHKVNEEHPGEHIYFMVDMAHIAGIVAAKKCNNPIYYADIVTSTTHKTLRGPRGGLILTNDDELIKKINSAVFPYTQGGPLEHIIAAKAQCFYEASQPYFVEYITKVLNNTKSAQLKLQELGAVVSKTDNHLFLLNTLNSYGLTGKQAQLLLEQAGITTNKNMMPGDTLTPAETSGLRIGFAALTTRGCTEAQAEYVAKLIHQILSNQINILDARLKVKKLAEQLLPLNKI